MAENTMFNVNENFSLAAFADQLTEKMRMKGYKVDLANLNQNYTLVISKNNDGIQKYAGLGQYIEANITKSNNTVSINYANEDWLNKIIACGIGWLICFIPFFTGIFGIIKQVGLSKDISNEARMIASNMQ